MSNTLPSGQVSKQQHATAEEIRSYINRHNGYVSPEGLAAHLAADSKNRATQIASGMDALVAAGACTDDQLAKITADRDAVTTAIMRAHDYMSYVVQGRAAEAADTPEEIQEYLHTAAKALGYFNEQAQDRPAKTHTLKVWPQFIPSLESGEKTFEARKNDRDFRVGDTLELVGWDPKTGFTTGWAQRRKITYILFGPAFGVEDGWAILGLIPLQVIPHQAHPQHVRDASDADILLELWKRKTLVEGLREAFRTRTDNVSRANAAIIDSVFGEDED